MRGLMRSSLFDCEKKYPELKFPVKKREMQVKVLQEVEFVFKTDTPGVPKKFRFFRC